MTESEKEARALFRYGLISEFLRGGCARGEQARRMAELAARPYDVPWQAKPYRVSASKLARWLSAYRRQGIKGLQPRARQDKGRSRAVDPLLEQRLLAVKRERPEMSVPLLIRALEDAGEVPAGVLRHSTVHRLLQRHRLSGRPGRDRGHKPQRLPYQFSRPMELWAGDVMHGRLPVAGRKVYLIAFLDNASRAIMHAAFSIDEGAMSMLRVFRQAVLVRGIPHRVYVDHGSAYIDQRFVRTCAHLGAHLIHAPVADGAAKGCIERWFSTVRDGFEAYLQPDDIQDLATLNTLLWNWIHTTYHPRPHAALGGESPWQRFLGQLADSPHRRVAPEFDFDALWLVREERTVRRDGTVSLHGHWLEAPPTVIRQRVELRFIPESLPASVEVWEDGLCRGKATPVDLEANTHRRRWRPQGKPAQPAPLSADPLRRARERWTTAQQPQQPSPEERS